MPGAMLGLSAGTDGNIVGEDTWQPMSPLQPRQKAECLVPSWGFPQAQMARWQMRTTGNK